MPTTRILAAIAVIAAAAAPARPTSAQVVDVLVLDGSRTGVCKDLDYNVADGNFFARVRENLLDEVNFGPGGVILRPISFLPPVPRFTAEALEAADVVLVSVNAEALVDCEVRDLARFIQQGGGVFFFANPAAARLGPVLGATAMEGGDGGNGVIVDPESPIADGPFGAVADLGPMSYHRWFADVGPFGNAVVASSAPFAVTFEVEQGRAVLFNDEEWCGVGVVPGCAAGQLPNANRERLFNNCIAYIIPAVDFQFEADPDPCAADIDCSGGVDFADLLAVLAVWGPYDPCPPYIRPDVNRDCTIDFADLLDVLAAWGLCSK